MGKWLLPMVKQRFVCDRFPQGELASGKFPWIHQKGQEKNNPSGINKNPKRLNQSRESEMYQAVKIT